MGEKEIKIGDKAPLFELDSYNAGKIDLSAILGKEKIVLIFSRYFGCPICHLDLNSLLERISEIENKGAKVLYITQSGEKIAKQFIEQKNIKFPVIPSLKDEMYKEYGLGMMTPEAAKEVRTKFKESIKAGLKHGEYEGWEKQGPGQFVIDEQGNIIHERKGWLLLPEIFSAL